ncbi:MAG: MFS transporter [Planctomycetota bacterium]
MNLESSRPSPASRLGRAWEAYIAPFRGLPREVWYLSVVMLINRSGAMVLPFLTLYVNRVLGYPPEWAGAMIAWFGLGSCLGAFFGGWLVGRVGPLRVQVVSFSCGAIGFLVLSQVTSYVWFSAVLFAMSVASEAFRPANAAAIADFSPPEAHSRAYALNRLAINLGFSIGPPLGGWISSFSYLWLFLIDAATCGLAALAVLLLFRGRTGLVRHEDAQAIGSELRRSPWRDRWFLGFLGLTLLTYMIFFQLVSTYSLYLSDEYHLANWEIGILLGLNTLGVVCFEMLLVNLLADFSKLWLIAWGGCLMCVGMSALVFGHGFWFAAAAVLVWTLGEMLAMPQAMAFVAAYAGPADRGKYMGAYTTAISGSFVLASLFGGWCYGIDHHLVWYVGLVVGALSLSGYLGLARSYRRV